MAYQRKADDNQIVALNNVGLSLTGIAERLDIHHTTVAARLRTLGIEPTDTRRAFMEDIFKTLTIQQQNWLSAQLGPGHSIKEFIRSLIIKEFVNRPTTFDS